MESKIFSCIESRIKDKRSYYSRYKIGPFLRNQAHIYSNTLRRILLSNTNNIVISAVNIVGIKHEYEMIKGVKESTLDLLLNLKEVIFICDNSKITNKFYFCYLKCSGPKIVTSKDLILPNTIRCVDENQYIATLTEDAELMLKIKLINKQEMSDYLDLSSDYNSLLSFYFNSIFNTSEFLLKLDSNFSCVNKVNYNLTSSNFLEEYGEYVELEVWTNASLSPYAVLQNSVKDIVNLFLSTYDLSTISLNNSNRFFDKQLLSLSNKSLFLKNLFVNSIQIKDESFIFSDFFKLNSKNIKFDELELSSNLKLLLARAGITNLRDITKFTKKELLFNFNISFQCLQSIEEKMLQHGLMFRNGHTHYETSNHVVI